MSLIFILQIWNFAVVIYLIWVTTFSLLMDCIILICGSSRCFSYSLDQRYLVLGFAFHLVIHGLACWSMFYLDLIHFNEMLYSEISCSYFQICNFFLRSMLIYACFCQNSKGILKRKLSSFQIWNRSDFFSTDLP